MRTIYALLLFLKHKLCISFSYIFRRINKKELSDKSVCSVSNSKQHSDQPNIEPYTSDILNYLRIMEKKRRPMVDYIEKVQRDITTNTRGTVVDLLLQAADYYKLLPETLHLSVSYIDLFLSIQYVKKSNLRLLGVSSMLVATKYEETNPLGPVDFSSISHTKKVVKMEADILKLLNFELGIPNVNTFLKEFVRFATESQNISKLQMEFLCDYLAGLSLLEYECIRFLPSNVAASIIFLAIFIIQPEVHPWTSSLSEYLGYKSAELEECVRILHDLYLSRRAASLKTVREKYKQHKFKYVANLPSPSEVPNHYFEE